MKLLIATALLVLSAQESFAQRRPLCEVQMVDSTGRVLDTFSGQMDGNGICRDALRECNLAAQGVRTRVSCIESRVRPDPRPNPNPFPNPRPDPRPNPNPYPNPYPPTVDLDVTVVLENSVMQLRGYSVADINSQCLRQVPFGSFDKMTLVTNNSNVRFLTTYSWWRDAREICGEVSRNIDLYSRSIRGFVDVYGDMERQPFSIRAYSKAEALAQCADAYRTTRTSMVDEINLSVNNSAYRRLTTYSWWKNASEVCNEVMKVIDQTVY
jgi:hypothetical protein